MDDQELIELYWLGRLSSREESELLQRCERDEALARRLRDEQHLSKAFSDSEALEYLDKVEKVLAEASSRNAKLSWIGSKAVLLAIAAVMIVLVGLFFISSPENDSLQLFAQYFEPYPMLISNRGDDQKLSHQLVNAYDQGDWKKVLEILPVVDLEKPLNDLYRAIAHLKLGEDELAKGILVAYQSKAMTPMYQNMLDWYLALTYLKTGEHEKATFLLRELERGQISRGLRLKVRGLLKELG